MHHSQAQVRRQLRRNGRPDDENQNESEILFKAISGGGVKRSVGQEFGGIRAGGAGRGTGGCKGSGITYVDAPG